MTKQKLIFVSYANEVIQYINEGWRIAQISATPADVGATNGGCWVLMEKLEEQKQMVAIGF